MTFSALSASPAGRRSAARYPQAVAMLRAGRAADALAEFDALLATEPAHAEALADSAVALAQLGRHDDAVQRFRRAVAAAPGSATAHHNLGLLLHQLGRFDEAAAAYAHSLSLDPADAGWWVDAGNSHLAAMRPREALDAYDEALRRDPGCVNAMANRAVALRALLRTAEAEAACRALIARVPGHADAWSNLGMMLKEADRLDEAAAALAQASALAPHSVVVGANLCALHLQAGRRREALALAQELVQRHPAAAEAWTALSHAQLELGLFDDALASCARALDIAPGNHSAAFNRAFVLLLRGEYAAGFDAYEVRRQVTNQVVQLSRATGREWNGAPLRGETILLTTEQGAGDMFQFIRYVALLKARGAGRVLVEAQTALATILATAPGVDDVAPTEAALPPYDLHVPLLSLPRLFGTTLPSVPATVPYLHAPARLVASLVRDAPGLRVGFVWSGNPRQNRNRIRSVPLAELLQALDLPGVSLFSLQVGGAPEPSLHEAVQAGRVTDLAPELKTFADSAAAIAECDLVVSVCTSVAHLAGALGRPTWTLLARIADWRWLLDREDSPWYPTMRLFRQEALDDWSRPLAMLRMELARLASGARAAAVPRPDHATATFERATRLHGAGALDAALAAYDVVLALAPTHADALNNSAILLAQRGEVPEAERRVRAAITIRPLCEQAHNNLALMLHARGADAESALRAGLEVIPASPLLLGHLARLCLESGRLDHSMSAADQMVALTSHVADGEIARGCVLLERGQLDAARAAFTRACAIDPANSGARLNLSMLSLLDGDLATGLPGFEHRLAGTGALPALTRLPGVAWDGGALDGQHVLVQEEQGLGDLLQFVRYAAQLKARGAARVTVQCASDAAALIGSVPGVDAVALRGAALPAFDVHVPILSLPYRCGTTMASIPTGAPYLTASERPVAQRVREAPNALKVGLVWGGNPRHQRDRYRSMPLSALLSAVHGPGVALFSLQKGPHAAALAPWLGVGIVDLDPHLGTLEDTAAAILALDLVVTVDTAVAHLAGALGQRTWLLLPSVPDWRWFLGRDDSPWYPTMRLFRQATPGDWTRPLGALRAALQEMLAPLGAR